MSGATLSAAEASRTWDAIVIGAGPAGSIAAIGMARRGLDTLLIDKAFFPRSKVCGCCLNRSALNTLDRLGLGRVPIALGGVPLDHVVLISHRGRRATLPLTGGLVISRTRFDEALVQRAIGEGAQFLPGTAAIVGACEGQYRTVHTAERGPPARAAVVIAADGLAGTSLSRLTGFGPRCSRRSRIGIGAVLRPSASNLPLHTITMMCGRSGYVGAVRLEDGSLDVAAAIDPRWMKSVGGPGAAVSTIFRDAGIEADLTTARWRGTPALTRRRLVESERLVVVGDAAAYVEPFTGEGMAWAIAGAEAAASYVHELIVHEARSCRRPWKDVLRAITTHGQRECRILAGLLRRPVLSNAGIAILGAMPALASPIVRRINCRGATT